MMLNLFLPLVTAFVICAVIGPLLIPFLHKLKFGQSIRDCGPASHMKKSGTPTMGGIMILIALAVSVVLWCPLTPAVVIALILTLGHALIGFLDDYIKVVMKRNLGLTTKQKFLCQFILAGAYVYYAETHLQMQNTTMWFPGVNATVNFGWAFYVIVFLLLVGTTNAVNLTDGLDGLASFVTLPVTLTFAAIAYGQQQADLAGFALALCGGCTGFLLFNHYPAKVFMGDTGSLAIGGGIGALALLTKTEILLILLGGVYVAEATSVIVQVAYFKYTRRKYGEGRRVFRMTPIHHHFELCGWVETKVVTVFTMISCILCVLGYGLWLLQ